MVTCVKNHHVLIVEDNPDLRYIVATLLETINCQVTTAENGLQALQKLNDMERLPCLIFLDLFMPVMDGWTLLSKLGQDERFSVIPIIVMSAVADDARSSKNVVACLTKPVSFNQLISVVEANC